MSIEETKTKVISATCPTWKKVLYWTLGILALLTIVIIVVAILVQRKHPKQAVDDIVKKTKREIAEADMDAKIKMAEAEKMEESVIEELRKIKEEAKDDEFERAQRLAAWVNQ